MNEGAHEAIVDTPLWHRAQRRAEAHPVWPQTDKWLLSAIANARLRSVQLIVWKATPPQDQTSEPRSGAPADTHRRYVCKNSVQATPRVSVSATARTLTIQCSAAPGAKLPSTKHPRTPLLEAVVTQPASPSCPDRRPGEHWHLRQARRSAGVRAPLSRAHPPQPQPSPYRFTYRYTSAPERAKYSPVRARVSLCKPRTWSCFPVAALACSRPHAPSPARGRADRVYEPTR